MSQIFVKLCINSKQQMHGEIKEHPVCLKEHRGHDKRLKPPLPAPIVHWEQNITLLALKPA